MTTTAWDQMDGANAYRSLSADPAVYKFREGAEREINHWINKSPIACVAENCPHCTSGDQPQIRFICDAVTPSGEEVKVRLSRNAARCIAPVREKLGADFHSTWLKCWQEGHAFDTTYHFQVAATAQTTTPPAVDETEIPF